jgi:hypothetical protein
VRIALLLIALVALSCEPATTPKASLPEPTTGSPLPTIGEGNGRFIGRVTDAKTGKPIEGVCVIIAVGRACQPNFKRTDANGVWWVDLPVGPDGIFWDVIFEKDGYQSERRRIKSQPGVGVQVVEVQLTPL